MTVQKQTKPNEPKKTYRWVVFWTGEDNFGKKSNRITTEETQEDLLEYSDFTCQRIRDLSIKMERERSFANVCITNIIERRQTSGQS